MNFFMKKWFFIVSLFVIALSVSLPAEAHRGWRRGWGLGTGLIVGGFVGAELARPYYYPPAYVYTPTAVVVQQPTIVQQSNNNGQASVQTMWNYCESSRGYYPNVESCPEGWKIVPATPSSSR